jgi:ferredoxin
MVMAVGLDTTRCSGHGRCYTLVPDLFEADDAGYGRVIDRARSRTSFAAARVAEDNCPERAITVVEEPDMQPDDTNPDMS